MIQGRGLVVVDSIGGCWYPGLRIRTCAAVAAAAAAAAAVAAAAAAASAAALEAMQVRTRTFDSFPRI